jgi:Mg2+-importing ATPase
LNAFHHTGFANPIDAAILSAGHVETIGTSRRSEVPYDFQRRRLSVLVAKNGTERLVTKGAVDDVLAACASVACPEGRLVPLAEREAAIRARFQALSKQGYRVLGVADKELAPGATVSPDDEAEMTFLGFVSFLDPPKPGVDRTLRELAALGVSLRMVTGDNRFAAAHVAESVGLDSRRLLTGEDLRGMSDGELARQVGQVGIFAEVDPVQKERIVGALRRAGHDVGYLGDGINDAPALHAADVGISVDTGVDVAKDAASIVLLAKDLKVLMQGVRLGRQTFANTLKYIFVTTSANFGNMASMAVATPFLPFLPLLPLQILLINFLTDLPGTTIATDAVDPEQLQRPGAWDIRFIRDFMVTFGLVSSAFDLFTFAVLRLAFQADAERFRSGWFVESVATELAVMLVLRTRRRFFRSRPGPALLLGSVAVAVVALALPFGPLAEPFGFVRLSVPVLLTLGAITAAYVVATELAKTRFYDRPARAIPRSSGPTGR